MTVHASVELVVDDMKSVTTENISTLISHSSC